MWKKAFHLYKTAIKKWTKQCNIFMSNLTNFYQTKLTTIYLHKFSSEKLWRFGLEIFLYIEQDLSMSTDVNTHVICAHLIYKWSFKLTNVVSKTIGSIEN